MKIDEKRTAADRNGFMAFQFSFTLSLAYSVYQWKF